MEDKLLRIEGYIFRGNGETSEEDIDYIEGKIIELLENEGFCFAGISKAEENDYNFSSVILP